MSAWSYLSPLSVPSESLFLCVRRKFGFTKKICRNLLCFFSYQPNSYNTHAESEWAGGTFLRQQKKVPPAHAQWVLMETTQREWKPTVAGMNTCSGECFGLGCPSICKSADCLSAHLLIFILAGKHDRFENVDMSTCWQIWLFSACGRPGTKFYVGPPHGNLNPLSSLSMILP